MVSRSRVIAGLLVLKDPQSLILMLLSQAARANCSRAN